MLKEQDCLLETLLPEPMQHDEIPTFQNPIEALTSCEWLDNVAESL